MPLALRTEEGTSSQRPRGPPEAGPAKESMLPWSFWRQLSPANTLVPALVSEADLRPPASRTVRQSHLKPLTRGGSYRCMRWWYYPTTGKGFKPLYSVFRTCMVVVLFFFKVLKSFLLQVLRYETFFPEANFVE